MALVFVSYSRKDTEFVQGLVNDLRQHKIPLWFDQDNIPPGARWDIAIEHALEDASHVLLVMSQWSVESENVRDEIDVAMDEKKMIVPILIGDCKLPLRVRRMQYTDFREGYDAGLQKILKVFADANVKNTPPEKEIAALTLTKEQKEQFWQDLLKRSKGRINLFIRPHKSSQNVLSTSTGVKGLKWRYALHRKNVSVQLYIGTRHQEINKYTFDELYANKQAIEAAFGEPLEWERLDDNVASRIKKTLDVGSAYSPPDDWPAMQEAMIEAMIRLVEAIKRYSDGL